MLFPFVRSGAKGKSGGNDKVIITVKIQER